jgi:hypothetical protein
MSPRSPPSDTVERLKDLTSSNTPFSATAIWKESGAESPGVDGGEAVNEQIEDDR